MLNTAELIEIGDVEALCAHIDALVLDERWTDIVVLHHGCRAALERGRQLWPASAYAEYRLALDAPGQFAAAVVDSDAARYTLGPFAEVMASTHEWVDLAPYLAHSPGSSMVAHEAVMRGADLTDDPIVQGLPAILDLPLVLQSWEPSYSTACYRHDHVEHDSPTLPRTLPVRGRIQPARPTDDPRTLDALLGLVRPWVSESNGRSEARAVVGDLWGAISSLGVTRPNVAEVGADEAMALLGWAAATGGAHGRRRGAAVGRSEAWWVATHLTGLNDGEPVHPDELGEAVSELRWAVWDAGEPDTGWALRIAVEDPAEGLAWVLAAIDAS